MMIAAPYTWLMPLSSPGYTQEKTLGISIPNRARPNKMIPHTHTIRHFYSSLSLASMHLQSATFHKSHLSHIELPAHTHIPLHRTYNKPSLEHMPQSVTICNNNSDVM